MESQGEPRSKSVEPEILVLVREAKLAHQVFLFVPPNLFGVAVRTARGKDTFFSRGSQARSWGLRVWKPSGLEASRLGASRQSSLESRQPIPVESWGPRPPSRAGLPKAGEARNRATASRGRLWFRALGGLECLVSRFERCFGMRLGLKKDGENTMHPIWFPFFWNHQKVHSQHPELSFPTEQQQVDVGVVLLFLREPFFLSVTSRTWVCLFLGLFFGQVFEENRSATLGEPTHRVF